MTMKFLLWVLFIPSALADCSERTGLFITAPKTIEALKGSCVQIPCSFRVKNTEDQLGNLLTGVWLKDDPRFSLFPGNVIFNSSSKTNPYPMNITGNLAQAQCTTLFSDLNTSYSDDYFFRIEHSLFRATAICDPVQIQITDSPPRPTIDISGDVRDLKEEESVTVTCSAPTPCPRLPPQLTWSLQDARNQTVENSDGTLTTKIQTTITLTDAHDGNIISCSASYPVDGGEQEKTSVAEMTLSVSYAPKNTSASISPSGLVSAGSRVNLSCSSRAKPPISSFTWFKSSKDGATRVSEGHFYSFNVTDGGAYYCVAANDLGNQTSPQVDLTIKGEGQVSSFQWELVLGGLIGIIGLVCLIIYVLWLKSMCGNPRQSPNHTGEEMIVEEATSKTEVEETIHYGEIDFSRLRPAAGSVQDTGQAQGTVYAEVNISRQQAGGSHGNAQTADDPDHLYAQVMKK